MAEVSPKLKQAIQLAESHIGQNEHSAEIRSFLRGEHLDPAKSAWCAAFVNSVFKASGISPPESQMATYYLGWGRKVDASHLRPGDVVVWGRTRHGYAEPHFGRAGHVAMVESVDDDGGVSLIHGNKQNAVTQETKKPGADGSIDWQGAEFRRAPRDPKGRIRIMTRLVVR